MVVVREEKCLPMAAGKTQTTETIPMKSLDVYELSLSDMMSDDTEEETEYVYSHEIVYQQLRDVLQVQKKLAEQQNRSNIETLNSSKQCLQTTLKGQEETINNLVTSIKHDHVLKEDYLQLAEELEKEKKKLKETKACLVETKEKEEASQKYIADLLEQLEAKTASYSASTDSLRENIQALNIQKNTLKAQLNEKTEECESLKRQLLEQKEKVTTISNKHEKQKSKWKRKVNESEVEKQQTAYMRQMSIDHDNKNRKGKNTNPSSNSLS